MLEREQKSGGIFGREVTSQRQIKVLLFNIKCPQKLHFTEGKRTKGIYKAKR